MRLEEDVLRYLTIKVEEDLIEQTSELDNNEINPEIVKKSEELDNNNPKTSEAKTAEPIASED